MSSHQKKIEPRLGYPSKNYQTKPNPTSMPPLQIDEFLFRRQGNKEPALSSSSSEYKESESKSTPSLKQRYDVFISYTDETIPRLSASRLYAAFRRQGVVAFEDDPLLRLRGHIPLQAIEGSRISIIFFSEGYAGSMFRMQELEKIMECHRTMGQMVVPVFQWVDPSDIRQQKGKFGDDFENLINKIALRKDMVLSWRTALRDASKIAGFESKFSKVAEDIVRYVTHSLNRRQLFVPAYPVGAESCGQDVTQYSQYKKQLFVPKYLVGVESCVQDVLKLLNYHQSNDIVLLGISGREGIGKTTIAKVIYNQISHSFKESYFLANIREVWLNDTSDVCLQERLLSGITKQEININDIEFGKHMLKETLCSKNILLVLDDVNKLEQMQALCGSREWFGARSRIIITTRDEDLLRAYGVDDVYRMKEMDHADSTELFSWHAFNHPSPTNEFAGLTRDVVDYCGGLPLALQAFGSTFYGREITEWMSAVDKLKRAPGHSLQDVLRKWFDDLNGVEQEIFLDIACFFIGMDRNDVTHIFNGCGLHANIGMRILMDRGLVTVDSKNKLRMHTLLRDMGREIICEESTNEPGKRRRILFREDALHVLSTHSGTDAVEGLALKYAWDDAISLRTEAFKNMNNLRFLQLAGVKLTGEFRYLSRKLRWLCWHGFPLKYIPTDLYQEKLVAIELEYSNLKLMWKEAQLLEDLKILNLSHSRSLRETPDFSYLPILEKLILKDCPSLSSVSHTIAHLNKLLLINLKGCTSLKKLPRSVYKLKSLQTLNISGCSKISKLKEDMQQMESLTTLIADNTDIKSVPFAVVRSKSVKYISLGDFEGFSHDVFPSIIWSWMSPTYSLSSLLQTSSGMSSLVSLNLPSSFSDGISFLFRELPNLLSLSVTCDSRAELNRNIAKILDTLNAAAQVSHMKTSALIVSRSQTHISKSSDSLNSLLVHMGKHSQVTNILKEIIVQKLSTGDRWLPGDNYPDWLTFNRDGFSLIFKVRHVNGRNLKTMTLSIDYDVVPEGLTHVVIINHTKGTIHIYRQCTLEGKGWHGLISTLKPGNKVEVVTIFGSGFTVKKTSVYPIYSETSDKKTERLHALDKNVLASGSSKKPRISDVYLSFRDEDTDASFISHLCTSLQHAGIYISKDLIEAHPRGYKISTSQLQEIEKCSVSVIVFSRNYANSMWCLEELKKIMKCRGMGQVVVPIFYGVNPSEVRHQTGMFGEAFEHFLKGVAVHKDKEMSWRKAFWEAGGISGHVMSDSRYYETEVTSDMRETEDIKNVVQIVAHFVDTTTVLPQVQGVVEKLKKRQLDTVQLLGIWGMGGIGKTTFAKAIYNQIDCEWDFEGSSFLPNIREVWQEDTRHVSLQEQLLFDIYPSLARSIDSIESGKRLLKEKLSRKKVLILLDHVNKLEQLEALCGGRQWFGLGSVIIITTRDKGLFDTLRVDHVHKMKEMSEKESLQLFSSHAFKQASPREGFEMISGNLVGYSGGLPLALVVLGRDLFGKEIREWKNVLDGLQKIPHPQVHKALKVSYDDLDHREKEIFLDIAYFFVGMDRKNVIHELKSFGSLAEIGINALVERSLITIDENDKLGIHFLLRHMAKEIIREQTQMGSEKIMYDVFLSFRGKDTRTNFTSHLYAYLKNAGINVFMDDKEMRTGERVSMALFKAIEQSKISVIVLSKAYANSRWCLKELEKIMGCHETKGQVVMPVFYHVEPANVRHQTGMFGNAFEDLMKHISMDNDKVQSWRKLLQAVADFTGFVVDKTRNESGLIKSIVERVTGWLNRTYLPVAQHPVGVETHAQKVLELLDQNHSQDPLLLGIWGMGGIGKTTVAKAIFNKIGCKFEGRSFLLNIRVDWKRNERKIALQKQLLSDICQTTGSIHDIDSGKSILKERLSHRKVLLVLDHVSNKDQLDALCGNRDWFGKGSRVIITTRDEQTFKRLEVECPIYEMKEMSKSESVELFSWHAFNQANPEEKYAKLSGDVVEYCRGLPLALEVLGSYLCRRDIKVWKSALEKLKTILNEDVHECLRISYDGLDHTQKQIFLHIAFFFIGVDRNDVIQILDECNLFAEDGISVLLQQCLVTVENNNKLGMHDLLRDMGRKIVHQESPQRPEMRSRLWDPKEVIPVLSRDRGTNSVEGLTLRLPSTRNSFGTKAFEKMEQLKLLQLASVQLNGDFGHLSKDLIWLHWHGFSLRHIPAEFCLESLVAIELEHSAIKLLWRQAQELEKLKILNLSHSHSLRKTPDFSFLPNLEKIILEDCPNLFSVCHKIGLLNKLLLLNVKGCTSLRKLPRSIYMLKSLKTLNISKCSKIKKLEEDLELMESLTRLIADETAIKRVPLAVVRSESIEYISLCGFEGLSRDVFPSIIWSWMSPSNNCLSLIQTSAGMSLVSLEVPSCSCHILSSIFKDLRKLRSLRLYCGSELQLDQNVERILDTLKATRFTGVPSTSQVSNTENSLNCLLIQMGMNCHVTSAFKDSMLQNLPSFGHDFFPSDNCPHWVTRESQLCKGSSVIFEVPQVNGRKLKTVMCFVYYSSPENFKTGLQTLLIKNYTKATILVYKHNGLTPEEDERNIMSNLEAGDKVEVNAFSDDGFIVKKTTIVLVYEELFDKIVENCHAPGSSRSIAV